MLHLSKITVLLINVILLANNMSALCNKCNLKNHVACYNETAFSICINGEPTLSHIECPENHQCTINQFICYRKTESTSACPETNSTPSLDLPNSVPSTTSDPSTTKAPRDPLTTCREEQKEGSHVNEMDSTCVTYILCHQDKTTKDWSGTVLTCGQQWFNGKFCYNEKPTYCL